MGKKTKAVPARKPIPAQIEKISKKKKPAAAAVVTEEKVAKVLPTVQTDAILKDISVKSKAVEKKEEAQEQEHQKVKVKRKDSLIKKSTEKGEPLAKKKKKNEEKEEKVEEKEEEKAEEEKGDKKQKKKKENVAESRVEDKSYLSLENPAEDDKKINVPSYSYKKARGVVYISHIPHGFYEAQMGEFFKQFGAVTNLRLGRSRKSGKSRGYAFVEFKFEEVAKVVAETMNNYLMFNKILKCEIVPKEKRKPNMFMGKINPNKPPMVTKRRNAKKLVNAVKTEAEESSRIKRQQRTVDKLNKKMKSVGIEYNVNVS